MGVGRVLNYFQNFLTAMAMICLSLPFLNSCGPGLDTSGNSISNSSLSGKACVKKIFVSFTGVNGMLVNGSLSGTAGADSICSSEAASAGLLGEYRAVISSPTRNAIDLVPDCRIIDVMNTLIANHGHELFGPTSTAISLNAAVIFSANHNNRSSVSVWSGSYFNGYYNNSSDCSNWNSSVGGTSGMTGFTSSWNGDWISKLPSACNSNASVYCVEQL